MNLRITTPVLGLSALSLVAGFASQASAAITSVSGATTFLGSPPASCTPGALGGFTAFAWDEQQGLSLSLAADMVNNPGTSTSPIAGSVAGVIDSHFIHFDGTAGAIGATGSVTFNGTIAGVMITATGLDNTDAVTGSFGTVYPTFFPFRGLATTIPSVISISGNTLNFNLSAISPAGEVAQVRVFTRVPAPGPAAAGLALAALGASRRRRLS